MEKRTAVVTGASSGIGAEIAKCLCEDGITVYGIGRDFSGTQYENPLLHKIQLDLRERETICGFVNELKENNVCVDILVNCAGTAFYGLHENLRPEQISDMVRVNVEAPLLLTSLLLKDLRQQKGVIINISSVTAKSGRNTHGAAYGATKAALSSFGSSLFEEVRKHGIKVCTIHPDLTDTALYRNADFTVSGEQMSCLAAAEVAEAAMRCIHARDGMVFTDITVRPSLNVIVKKRGDRV